MSSKIEIIRMSEIEETKVNWLWYPYIPYGRLSIIYGDPGEGKTSLALKIAAMCSTGERFPFETDEEKRKPINVIYQTAEDGLSDTIKPRLLKAGADCEKVLVINDSDVNLSLDDERIEVAIRKTQAKLLILDPIQAYLGMSVDMNRANNIRPILGRLNIIAEQNDCAIILIGHMNKTSDRKAIYRGLGSIDFVGAARSVLIVGKPKNDPEIRVMAQTKNNLALIGDSLSFKIDDEKGIIWNGYYDLGADELASGNNKSKIKIAEELLLGLLVDGKKIYSNDIISHLMKYGISKRTVDAAKKNCNVKSKKEGDKWYWYIEESITV